MGFELTILDPRARSGSGGLRQTATVLALLNWAVSCQATDRKEWLEVPALST